MDMNESIKDNSLNKSEFGEIPPRLFPEKDFISEGATVIVDQPLSTFQKILLTTDGTVTDLIALYAGEPIRVKKIGQKMFLSDNRQNFFCPSETPLLERNVLLCGARKNYLYAESVFVVGLLSHSIQYKLLETDCPIGLMWKEEKLDMYRDILGHKTEICDTVAAYFDVPPQTPIISRTYSIYHRGKILGTITEKFPITFFRREM